MKIKEAYISNTIDSAKDKIQYDEHVRQILKDKGILAYILKYAVKEFKDYSIDDAKAAIDGEPEVAIRSVRPEAVSTLENESKIPGEGKMYFDILFYAVTNDGYRQKMYINIEAQKSFYPGYDLVTRGIVYPARLISQQMDVEYTADNYDGVKKVYSVWICMNAPEKKHSYKKVADSIVEYSIKPTILYPHNATDDEIATGRYDLMSTVFINLNSQNTINSKNVLISMLSTLLSDKIKVDEKKQKLEKEYGIKMSKELESEVSSMCNLSEAIEERGIERGRMYTIYDFIQSGMITPEAGAQKLGISVEQLKEDMEAAGYHFPD
ncbi:MAG TPA: hypothetical protein DCE63_01210 [Eubacterium sp.]|nr:hypothetical protein [Eubacterium sp.]